MSSPQLIAAADWSVCLLQEAPPAWARSARERARSSAYRVLTSRNQLGFAAAAAGPLEPGPDGLLGRRLEPDPGAAAVADRRPGSHPAAQPAPATRPARTPADGRSCGCDATGRRSASRTCTCTRGCATARRARGAGGGSSGRQVGRSARRWCSAATSTCARAIPRSSTSSSAASASPHRPRRMRSITCSQRGLEVVRPPSAWAPRARELEAPVGMELRRLRLSDHAPVEATFGLPGVR